MSRPCDISILLRIGAQFADGIQEAAAAAVPAEYFSILTQSAGVRWI